MTLLHQAAQKAVEALKQPEGDWSLSAALAVMNEVRYQLESALQHQEVPREPVAADGFNGDTPNLVRSITALLELDAAGAMAGPHMGGHARTLLTAAANRLAASPSTTRQQEDGNV